MDRVIDNLTRQSYFRFKIIQDFKVWVETKKTIPEQDLNQRPPY